MSTLNTLVCTVFRNADPSDPGTKVLLNKTYVSDIVGFMEELSQTVEGLSGEVVKIYDAKGKAVSSLDGFKEDNNYVLVCEGETLNMSKASRYLQLKDSDDTFAGVSSGGEESQLEKANVIYVFRNGDKHHKGVKITLNRDRITTMDQLKEIMTDKVQPLTGAIRRVYLPDGTLIRDLDSFRDQGRYVAVGGELTLNTERMAKAIFDEEEEEVVEEKPARKHKYVSPMEKKEITKFGTQAEKARVIRVYANGDKYDKGTKVTINTKNILTHSQLLQLFNSKITLITGAAQKVYTPEGRQIRKLDDYEDGGKYIVCAGEKFNKAKVPEAALVAEEEDDYASVSSKGSSGTGSGTGKKKKVVRKKIESKPIEKFGTQASKAKVLYFFQNKDRFDKGTKITLNPKNILTHDQLKQHLTTKLKMQTGPVKKCYTTSGKLVRSLDAYEDYGKYVACGGEPFDISKLSPHALQDDEVEVKEETTMTTSSSSGSGSSGLGSRATDSVTAANAGKKKKTKAKYVSPMEKKEITKFGTQASKAKILYFFRNADKHDSGFRYSLNTKRVTTMTMLKDVLNADVKLLTGAIRKIYGVESESLVRSFEDLEDGKAYVCCGPEKPVFSKLSPAALKVGEELVKKEGKSKELDEIEVKYEYKSPVKKKSIKKFGTQAEKARVIYVFRNGDKHDKGTKITINPKLITDHDKLKYKATTSVGLLTGAVKKMYDANTKKLVRSFDAYVDGGKYIACGGEKLDTDKWPLALL